MNSVNITALLGPKGQRVTTRVSRTQSLSPSLHEGSVVSSGTSIKFRVTVTHLVARNTGPAGAPLLVPKTLEGELLERRAALVELLPTALASQIAGAGPKEHVVLLLLSRGEGTPSDVHIPVGSRAPR